MEQLIVMFVLFSLAFSISAKQSESISAKQSEFQSKHFISCLVSQSPHNRIDHFVFYQQSPSFTSILASSLMNLRFNTSSALKPIYIITPQCISHIQATVICCKRHGLQVRVRSGGHDYEGFSFTSQSHVPFVMIDMVSLRRVTVNAQSQTAWVQAGATLGELYYYVANHSGILAFPAGVCPTVGTGGHISGGGQGTLTRKYGLAADNVLDAVLVDVNGRILTRESMGEDLFWAIAGGGAANFGVIFKWKLRLVPVPPKVTVFNIEKTLEQNATQLIHKWQEIAPKLDQNLYIRLILFLHTGFSARQRTVVALFNSLYLGTAQQLVPLMKAVFPELGLEASDCREMTWIESVLFFVNSKLEEGPIEVLLDRNRFNKSFTKGKTDFVENPISEKDLEAILRVFMNGETEAVGVMIMDPYGGRMAEIPDSQTPFPHRAGTLYNIQYFTGWRDAEATSRHLNWIASLYTAMTPFVSNNPRAGYLNYRDLDLGSSPSGNATYSEAKIWGKKYYRKNFKRLARIKAVVDPENFFRNEQGIPPLFN